MNKLICLLLSVIVICSCNNQAAKQPIASETDPNFVAQPRADSFDIDDKDSTVNTGSTTEALPPTSADACLGAWAMAGEPNTDFVFAPDSVFYPERLKWYRYIANTDSIRIFFEDFENAFAWRMKGADTLVLISDSIQQFEYHRVKN